MGDLGSLNKSYFTKSDGFDYKTLNVIRLKKYYQTFYAALSEKMMQSKN